MKRRSIIRILATVILSALIIFGCVLCWRTFARPFDDRIIGTWKSDPQRTIDYWNENYTWVKDVRLLQTRSEGLGKMTVTITDREIRFKDHPCHGSPTFGYWITSQSDTAVNIGIDNYINFPHWATFEFVDGGIWSIAQMGDQEVREFFKKVEQAAP